MIKIDIHTHIFPADIAENREKYFPGEPVFKLLYESPKAKLATAERLLEAMDENRVDVSLVFGFPWERSELTKRHNAYVLESASRYSDRLIPLACVNPLADGSLREAERCLADGAKGLGELAIYGGCDQQTGLSHYRELFECCKSHSGLLLVHANEPIGHWYPGKAPFGIDFYYSLAKLALGVPLILAHWGGGLCFYELLRKEVPETLSNVYYDTAASPYLYRPDIYKRVTELLGAHKILFGSDYPLLEPARYFQEMVRAELAEEEFAAITGKNAARLLGLEGFA